MKIILFILTLYMLFTQFKDIKTKFKTFKDKMKPAIDKLLEKDGNINEKTLIGIQFIMTILLMVYAILVFNVVQIKIFQIVVCLCFMWDVYNVKLYIKLFKGEENKIMNSKLYSILSWILDTAFYIYIIYYIILNW